MRIAFEGKEKVVALMDESKRMRRSGFDPQDATELVSRMECARADLQALALRGVPVFTTLGHFQTELLCLQNALRRSKFSVRRCSLIDEQMQLKSRLYVASGDEHLYIVRRLGEIKRELATLR